MKSWATENDNFETFSFLRIDSCLKLFICDPPVRPRLGTSGIYLYLPKSISYSTEPLAKWVEGSLMVWETGIQSQVKS